MFGQQSRLRQWLSTNTSKNRVDCSKPFLIDAKHRLKNLKNWIDFEVSTIFLPRLERVFEFISFQHTKNLTNLFITIWRHELLSLIKYSGSLQSLINLKFLLSYFVNGIVGNNFETLVRSNSFGAPWNEVDVVFYP